MPYKKIGANKYTHGGKTFSLDQIQAIEIQKHRGDKRKKKKRNRPFEGLRKA